MTLDTTKLPQHVAIIMDGNRRWAKKQGLAAIGGHNYVVDQIIEPLIEHCGKLGIRYLTLWAFSTENWKRDKEEVNGLMTLFRRALMEKVEGFIKKGARLKMIGDLDRFSPDIQAGMQHATAASEKNDKITVTFAVNYGGRDEIIRAANRYSKESGNQHNMTEQDLEQYLDTAGMSDPDLIIRTGGEQRLSGFLPWQSVYSELYFTETLMPEFTTAAFDIAIEDYQQRQRRFGK
jgi:undecaprenyl diphosphate synthase